MEEITSAQRKKLRSMAHHLDAVCYIGKNGLTDAVVDSVRQALADHELIKVRFIDKKDERKTLGPELAEKTESHLAGLIGNVAILYKEQPDPEKRRIVLD